jgi:hypothetical protein
MLLEEISVKQLEWFGQDKMFSAEASTLCWGVSECNWPHEVVVVNPKTGGTALFDNACIQPDNYAYMRYKNKEHGLELRVFND